MDFLVLKSIKIFFNICIYNSYVNYFFDKKNVKILFLFDFRFCCLLVLVFFCVVFWVIWVNGFWWLIDLVVVVFFFNWLLTEVCNSLVVEVFLNIFLGWLEVWLVIEFILFCDILVVGLIDNFEMEGIWIWCVFKLK